MHRLKLPSGPMFQNTGNACVHSMGNYYGFGGPGSGPRAASGTVIDANTVEIRFTQCVVVSSVVGVEITIDGAGWGAGAFSDISDTVIRFTVSTTIQPGDVVRWRYLGGFDSIIDCSDSADIGAQEIPVTNSLVLAGNFVLLSVGGKEITLLSNDVAQTEGVQTADA